MKFSQRLALCLRILRQRRGNLLAHVDREVPVLGNDEMGRAMAQNVREIALVLGTQGHSGMSANYITSLLNKVLRYEPLSPLTGAPDEWLDHGYCKQNKRSGRVFTQPDRFDGQPYDIEAVIFREPTGACFCGEGSFQPVTFPYTPRTVYVDVDLEGKPLDGWDRKGLCPAWVQA